MKAGSRNFRSVIRLWVPERSEDEAESLVESLETAGIPVCSYSRAAGARHLFVVMPKAGYSAVGPDNIPIDAEVGDVKKLLRILVAEGIHTPEFVKVKP